MRSQNPKENHQKRLELGSQYFRRYDLCKLGHLQAPKFYLNRSLWYFHNSFFSTKVQKLKFLECEVAILRNIFPNFRYWFTIFSEIWSVEVRAFWGFWISYQRGDRGKIFIALSLSIGLECCKKFPQVHRLRFLVYQFQSQRRKQWHVASHTISLYWTSPKLGHCGRLDINFPWRIQIRWDL